MRGSPCLQLLYDVGPLPIFEQQEGSGAHPVQVVVQSLELAQLHFGDALSVLSGIAGSVLLCLMLKLFAI